MKQKELLKQIDPKYLNRRGRKKLAQDQAKEWVKRMNKYEQAHPENQFVPCIALTVDGDVKMFQNHEKDLTDKLIKAVEKSFDDGELLY